jgi:CheY-like chemotaxis protein
MENSSTSNSNPQVKIRKVILVVDDTESVLSHIKSLLEKDYDIVTKSDGHEALVYLSQGHKPDLILTDMEMPNMNGRIFVRRVHTDPRHDKIPIVFITSINSEMLINSFKAMGVIDFIIKPFNNNELIEKVHHILQS